MAIGKKLRFEVFKRDSFICQYCGKSAPDVILHVDHILPVSKDGSDDITNLITSCAGCNLGKSNRLLSDDAVIKQRKRQLDELQERQEQLEMMMEWQRGLIDLDQQTIEQMSSFWSELATGFSLNDSGLDNLKKWVRRFGAAEVLDTMRVSASQYLCYGEDGTTPTHESVEKAFKYIPKICVNKRKMEAKPYLRQLYYTRGILKNRLSYYNEWQSIKIMEDAHLGGVSIDDIQDAAKAAKSWTQFKEMIEQLSEQTGGTDGQEAL